MSAPKIAFVYDRVNKIGGAEKVLMALHQLWPDAPLYTSVWNQETAPWSKNMDVRASFLNKVPFTRSRHELFAWLMPTVFESFTFKKYDIVISITSAEAKGIITSPQTLHLCYMLTPTRYLWSHTHLYRQQGFVAANLLTQTIASPLLSRLRRWDYIAAQRPDKIVAISKTVARRIEKYYHQSVDEMIYPPVAPLVSFSSISLEVEPPFYVVVSRLVPYKRIDLAVQAFNQMGKKLVVIGEGSQKHKLQQLAHDNVKILGKVSDSKLIAYYQQAQGLVFPSEEDFGIVCVEAQSLGKGVVAYHKGGAAETVINGQTGVLFEKQTVDALVEAINKYEKLKLNSEEIKAQAGKFSQDEFKQRFKKYVEEAWHNHLKINQ